MTEETKKEMYDLTTTGAWCGVAIAVVFNLNGKVSEDNANHEKPAAKIENVCDSVRTDSIPTADFVKFQTQQQKVR